MGAVHHDLYDASQGLGHGVQGMFTVREVETCYVNLTQGKQTLLDESTSTDTPSQTGSHTHFIVRTFCNCTTME